LQLSLFISFLTGSPNAQEGDYRSLVSLENEFAEVSKDVLASLQWMINKRSVEFDCLDVPFKAAF
jgi:hypothetical protein